MKKIGRLGDHVQLNCGHMYSVQHVSGSRLVTCNHPVRSHNNSDPRPCGVQSLVNVKAIRMLEMFVLPNKDTFGFQVGK